MPIEELAAIRARHDECRQVYANSNSSAQDVIKLIASNNDIPALLAEVDSLCIKRLGWAQAASGLEEKLTEVYAELERLTLERDALWDDLESSQPCEVCKNYDKKKHDCIGWEWRGLSTEHIA